MPWREPHLEKPKAVACKLGTGEGSAFHIDKDASSMGAHTRDDWAIGRRELRRQHRRETYRGSERARAGGQSCRNTLTQSCQEVRRRSRRRTGIPRNNAMPDLFSSPVDRNRAGRGEVEDVANNSAVGPADRRSRHHRRHPVTVSEGDPEHTQTPADLKSRIASPLDQWTKLF